MIELIKITELPTTGFCDLFNPESELIVSIKTLDSVIEENKNRSESEKLPETPGVYDLSRRYPFFEIITAAKSITDYNLPRMLAKLSAVTKEKYTVKSD